jgi:hypothetical protein
MDEMEQDKDELLYNILISDSIRFLESLGNYYGAERAMQVWKELGPTVGEDVKGQVFMTMLSGNGNSMRLELARPAMPYSGPMHSVAVPVIKAIRAATGIGLKEAKDLWDTTAEHSIFLTCISREHARSAKTEFLKLGMQAR